MKRWTPNDDAALRALRNIGKTVPEIAEILNREQRDITKRCVELVVPFPESKRKNFSIGKPRSEWPDYWTRNAAEGSKRLRDALLSFYEKRAA